MLYLKQLGVKWVSLAATPETATAEGFIKMREQWEAGGFQVYNIGSGVGPSGSLHNMPEVTLNLPGRDQKIEEYLNYIRYLGKAGIPYSTYAHMGNGIWRSGREVMPRGYAGSSLDLSSPNARGNWSGKSYSEPLSHGRVFTKEEIWDNYTYFIKKVVPVAEEAGVRIGIHPDDPPQPMLAGVPRCIFSNFEGYKKALEIANSPNIGICLCCGSWLEGGKKLTGKDPEEMIRYFGAKKIFKIHFRNVSAPLPHFTETMIDDGYYDMNKIMRALVDVKFEGIVIPDHVPGLGTDPRAEGGRGGGGGAGRGPGTFRANPALAYLLGCMNSMLLAAQGKA
jgi:mannonate dehydratase